MACQAFRVVSSEIMVGLLMRIVARQAADPRVIAHKASADRQPIGLEAHIRRPMKVVPHRGVPGAMTLTAEISDVLSAHGLERLGKRREVIAGGVGHVSIGAGMTSFAPHSRTKIVEIQLLLFGGVS